MREDKPTIVQLATVKAIDLSSAGQEIESDEAIKKATTAFRMGWEARGRGDSVSSRPGFADESLTTDWIQGWETRDRGLTRL